jgi:hypothetical protein
MLLLLAIARTRIGKGILSLLLLLAIAKIWLRARLPGLLPLPLLAMAMVIAEI